jgi:hypothetical protein
VASYKLTSTAYYYNGTSTAKDQDGQPVVTDSLSERPSFFPKNRIGGFARTLTKSPLYYNGSTSAKDQDGQLVLDPELVDRVNAFPTLKVYGPARVISFTPTYYDGVTTSKDIDGEMLLDTDLAERGTRFTSRYIRQIEGSVSGGATATGAARLRQRLAASVEGDATATGAARLKQSIAASVYGDATATGDITKRLQAAASVYGDATAVGTATLILSVAGSSSMALTAVGDLIEAIIGTDLPSHARNFFSGDALAPLEAHVVRFIGDVSVTNKLTVVSDASLAIAGGYSGVAYSFGGPADMSGTPYKLGFVRGDKLRLYGPMGIEPNHGRIVTFEDPGSLSIMEALTVPDATEYEFAAFRRLT